MDIAQDYNLAGREFDKWLDWNGNADAIPEVTVSTPSAHEGGVNANYQLLPASPSSSTSEPRVPSSRPFVYTASTTQDLPTPSHSSGSPELLNLSDHRLSGETLQDYPIIAARPLLKRKLSPQNIPLSGYERVDAKTANRKRPHNIIEKRYRANLNDKIAELRDSVPSLRVLRKAQARDGDEGSSGNEDLDGLTPSGKLNKASILTKAVEYIRHLELRNKKLDDENRALKQRLLALDRVIARGGDATQRLAAFTSATKIEEASASKTDHAGSSGGNAQQKHPPQGLIPVPESMRRLRENQSQEHYGHIYDTASERGGNVGKWPTRLMLGTLAALMIMEGLGEDETGSRSKEKGLFGIPLELLDGYRFLRSPRLYLTAFWQFCQAGGVVPLIKGFTALSMMAFFVFAYLFNSKPTPLSPEQLEKKLTQSAAQPCPASPIEVRRRAWSTSMQTLNLPHHRFFPEFFALTVEWLKYTVNLLFGEDAYTWVTGRSGDDEAARVKAWDIAIDAQLAGGDPEISRSRVVLTSFASGTLPRSPLRLMLTSLHCRLLMWRVGGPPSSKRSQIANRIGVYFARREWRRARDLAKSLPIHHPDRLADYLAALLDVDCDEVFTDPVVQRAYNLMYDRPTSEHDPDSLMDVVVEDHAIRSPLDAVAAWWSTQALRRALAPSLTVSISDTSARDSESEVQVGIESALSVAPPGSAAETRALAIHAVFCANSRPEYYRRASNALPRGASSPLSARMTPHFIDSSTPMSARGEISTILCCAKTMIIPQGHEQDSAPDHVSDLTRATEYLSELTVDANDVSVLSFAALHFVFERLSLLPPGRGTSPVSSAPYEIRHTVRAMCSWLHSSSPLNGELVPMDVAERIDRLCQELNDAQCDTRRRHSSESHDTGYASQESDADTPHGYEDGFALGVDVDHDAAPV